jgi:hypothetical protein
VRAGDISDLTRGAWAAGARQSSGLSIQVHFDLVTSAEVELSVDNLSAGLDLGSMEASVLHSGGS